MKILILVFLIKIDCIFAKQRFSRFCLDNVAGTFEYMNSSRGRD